MMQAHIFLRILANVSMDEAELAMFDSARCKDRGTAASLKAGSAPDGKDEGLPECRKSGIGMTRGGRNSIFHAIFDEMGRPMAVELTADNEYDRATAIPHIDRMPFGAKTLVADKGCDSELIPDVRKSARFAKFAMSILFTFHPILEARRPDAIPYPGISFRSCSTPPAAERPPCPSPCWAFPGCALSGCPSPVPA